MSATETATEASLRGVTTSRRGVRLLRPHGGGLAFVVVMLCLLALADMVQPWFLKLLIDDVFLPAGGESGNWMLLWLILPGFGLVYVGRNTLFFLSRMRSLRISEDVCFDLRKRLFEHLQQLSLRFYRSEQPGRVSARLMDDTFKLQSFIQDKLPMLIRYTMEFQVVLIVIYVVNWRLALASTVVLPLHFMVYRRFRRRIRQSHSEAQATLAATHGSIVERFLGVEVVKGFSAEERESSAFQAAIAANRAKAIRSQRYHITQKVAADLLVGLGTVLLLGYGAWEVHTGRMSGGSFFMFFWYVRMLYPALLEVISGTGHLSRTSGSLDRIFEMLDEPVGEPGVSESAVEPPDTLEGRLELEKVRFAYEADGPLILEDVSLTIEPGEHVAITGPSGAGKSTLVSLLPRFNVPTGGQLRLDGHPIETFRLHSLRTQLGIVFQEIFLFNASVYENLRYARPDATLEEVKAACRITGAHAFIQRLPDRYFTKIGSLAGQLSRGEKQRITLARALVRDPRILILDEATASLDESASRAILADILERLHDRTVIIVTHATELLDLADRVVTLESGRVTYDGPPEGVDLQRTVPRSPNPAELRERRERRGRRGDRRFSSLVLLPLLIPFLGAGCVRTTETETRLDVEQPKVSSGVLLNEWDPENLRKLAEALDAIGPEPPVIGAATPEAAADVAVQMEAGDAGAGDAVAAFPDIAADGVGVTVLPGAGPPFPDDDNAFLPPVPALRDATPPAGSVRLIGLPRLSATELRELLERLELWLCAEHGYQVPHDVDLPPPPGGVIDGFTVVRPDDGGGRRAIRFGHRSFVSQPPQLWVMSVAIAVDGTLSASADHVMIEPAVGEMITALGEMREGLAVRDLESRLVQLSYVDATAALLMLDGMGVTTVAQASDVPDAVTFDDLPYVVAVPDPSEKDAGLIGESTTLRGEFGVSLTPSIASQLAPSALTGPMTQLLVMFHPAHPGQYSHVRSLLDEYVDRPARQILVEGMVLEIAEDGLRDLGVDWELDGGGALFQFGTLQADGLDDTFFSRITDFDLAKMDFDWRLTVRALIRDGKAEILSRPSVLTINNRQSTIRVGQDIPIATSQESAFGSSNKIAFNFKYLPTGILLNIRPRINEEGSEVSLLVDTVVSDVVPDADLEIRSPDGELLASAPTVATRRVQTYARIRNNTPLIIGGLVSKLETTVMDKVPFLGDIPLIGAAFRAEKTEHRKREVIIVLTPYVLPESGVRPKDDDRFDSFGNDLFRDSYRIRAEDVFDLGFLFENQRLIAYRDLADRAIHANFRLAEEPPFALFAGNRVPGEEILITRMIYEVVKRLESEQPIDPARLIYFESKKRIGGYDVQFLERVMTRLGGGADARSFFRRMPGRALALTYDYDRTSMETGKLATEPIPSLALVDCPDREAWGNLLWDLNQPEPSGRERFTILINDESDLVRLRRAVVLARIVAMNGGRERLITRNFSPGMKLFMPDLNPGQVHVMDAEVARFFFYTEHYYAATIDRIESSIESLSEALERPEIRGLLE